MPTIKADLKRLRIEAIVTKEIEKERVANDQLINPPTANPRLKSQDFCDSQEPAVERFFPCRSNEEVRTALRLILNQSQIEVAGGVVRHHIG